MTWIAAKINNVTQPLNLESSINWLKLFGGIEEQIDKQNISSLRNKNVIEVLELLANKPDIYSDLLTPVFAAIVPEKTTSDILTEWLKLKDKYTSEKFLKLNSLAANFETLTLRANLPKLIKWKVLNEKASQVIELSEKASLNVGAMAKMVLEFEALPQAPELPVGSGAQIDEDKALLRIGINGDLSVNGRVGFSTDIINLGGGLSSGASVDADLYFVERYGTQFGIAVAENITDLVTCSQSQENSGLCSPFNADGLNNLFTRSGLYCLKMEAASTLIFDGSIGIGKSFSKSNEIKMKIGFSAGFNVQEKGKFEYLFAADQVDGEPVIAVQIKRVDGKQSELNESLSIELDPRELIKSLQSIVDNHLGTAEAVLKEFDVLLPGSDFIQDKLSIVIDNEFNDSEFRTAVKVLVGLDPDKSPEEVLRDRLIGSIETSSEGWSDDITTIFDDVVKSLQQYVPQLPLVVTERISNALTTALSEKQKLLLETVEKKLSQNNGFQTIASKLNMISDTFEQNINDVQVQINAVSNEIRKHLQAVQTTIGKVHDLTQVATEKTISLKLAGKKTTIEQETLNLRFDLYAKRDGAQDALDAILLGDMRQIFKLIRKQSNLDKPAVIGHSGSFKVYESLTDEHSAGMVIWDFTLLSKEITSAEVEWTVNLDGSISASSEAKYERTNNNKWLSREARIFSFIESSSLLLANPANTSEQQGNTLNLGLTLSSEEEKLSVNEVREFLNGLVQRKLLPVESVEKAVSRMHALGNRNLTRGRLQVGVNFENEQFAEMMSGVESMTTASICNDELTCFGPLVSCPENTGRKGCHWILDSVSKIQAEVFTQQHSDKQLIRRLYAVIGDNKTRTPASLAAAIRSASSGRNFSSDYQVPINVIPEDDDISMADYSFLEYRRYGAMALYEILAHMKALYETRFTQTDQDESDFTASGWTPKKLKAHQTRIARLAAFWWLWSDEKFEALSLTDQMRASNVALFESWIELAKGPKGEGSSPNLWATISLPARDGEGALKTIQLT